MVVVVLVEAVAVDRAATMATALQITGGRWVVAMARARAGVWRGSRWGGRRPRLYRRQKQWQLGLELVLAEIWSGRKRESGSLGRRSSSRRSRRPALDGVTARTRTFGSHQ